MKRLIWLIVAVLIVAGIIYGYSVYNKPHKDMRKQAAAYELNAKELFDEYEDNESAADEKYLGEILRVHGTVSNIQMEEGKVNSITFESGGELSGVVAEMDQVYGGHRADFEVGEVITLQCKCTGYLMDVILNRCVEIEK